MIMSVYNVYAEGVKDARRGLSIPPYAPHDLERGIWALGYNDAIQRIVNETFMERARDYEATLNYLRLSVPMP